MYDYGRWAVGSGNGLSHTYGQEEEYERHPVDTIVMVGIAGSGKSTLGNILAIRDDQPNIPMQAKE
jgi:adenylylsulfate kinase-like enzyme